jgi:hypothetical protein
MIWSKSQLDKFKKHNYQIRLHNKLFLILHFLAISCQIKKVRYFIGIYQNQQLIHKWSKFKKKKKEKKKRKINFNKKYNNLINQLQVGLIFSSHNLLTFLEDQQFLNLVSQDKIDWMKIGIFMIHKIFYNKKVKNKYFLIRN